MGKSKFDDGNPCICGTCHKTFDYSETKTRERKLYGKPLVEHCCPFCGSTSMTPLKEEWELCRHR